MKNKHARFMDLVHDTSSEMCLKMCEVSSKYLLRVSSYRADTIFVMDRQTDRQTDGRKGKTICLPTLPGGDINIHCLFIRVSALNLCSVSVRSVNGL